MVRGYHQGYPKKLGEIWMTRPITVGKAGPRLEAGGRFGATVSAAGRLVARATWTLTERGEAPGKNMSNQVADAAGQRERIDQYFERSGLASQSPRVVPLTGDASDRRYYRVLLPDAPSIVLSLYSGPFDVDTLSFVNVARLLEQMPVPIPTVLGHAGDLGVLALEDLGDVTLQAHLGAATPAEHSERTPQAVALIDTMKKRGGDLDRQA